MVRFAPATNVGENCSDAKGVVLWDIAKGWKVNNAQKGFTLIEIAIVLVIVGLLLVGVVKGQELISGARVRSSDLPAGWHQGGLLRISGSLPGAARGLSRRPDTNINCGGSPCLEVTATATGSNRGNADHTAAVTDDTKEIFGLDTI